MPIILPCGNIEVIAMKYAPEQIGQLVKKARKTLGVTQKDLALTSGTGLRFIIELEQGKATCQIGKVLTVLHTLGITMELTLPAGGGAGERVRP
jgi:HTH-type transcriptional regulator/antitoxin HipB